MTIHPIKDFLRFAKRPDDRQLNWNLSKNLGLLLILFTVEVVATLVFIIPVLEWIDSMVNLTPLVDFGHLTLQAYFFIVIMIPFIEEAIFRYFLRYQGSKTLMITRIRWDKLFPFLVYFSVIAFAAIHLTNFSNSSKWFYMLSPFVIMSQLFTGLIATYIRVRISFLWGVFYHCLWNFFFAWVFPAIEPFFG